MFPTDCHPDIVTMAKPLANGFPIGAILVRDSIAQAMTVGQPLYQHCVTEPVILIS
jgi:acetylornithine/succinyldiaminopimelate/putrescine aminotransferase